MLCWTDLDPSLRPDIMAFELGRRSPIANHLAFESATGSIYGSELDQRHLDLELLDCGEPS